MRSLILALAIALAAPVIGGCAREVSHTERTKTTWDGGVKRDATTVYENPDGSRTVQKESQRVRD